ncbi:MAG: glycosyltransferase family protein [Thermaurantimonas sp.]|uniref:glycosyltransferase family protein n=1 Tax=Thermaurantimonas sp. TaxID=2681568 RepID=UPI00391D3B99
MNPSVLMCVLNWGYGHAARCTIIAQHLVNSGHKIYIASDGVALRFLQKHLPECAIIPLPEYNIRYSKSGRWLILKMIVTFFRMIPTFVKEWFAIQRAINRYKPDVLISDTRPFCHSLKVPSIYITNQIEIRPFTLGFIHRLQIKKFNQVWIPAIEGDPIGGFTTKVFGNLKKKAHYIGYIPNYQDFTTKKKEKKYYIAAILSGPEPARTNMESLVLQEFKKIDKPTVLVRGVAGGSSKPYFESHTLIFDFLTLEKVAKVLSESEIYVGRSGFSGISMMVGLDIKAIVVPTQGQPEQEANAHHLALNRLAIAMDEKNFNLAKALCELENIYSLQNIKNTRIHFSELLKTLAPLKRL